MLHLLVACDRALCPEAFRSSSTYFPDDIVFKILLVLEILHIVIVPNAL